MDQASNRPSISLAQLEQMARESAERLAAQVKDLDRWSLEHESLELDPAVAPESVEDADTVPSTEEFVRRLRADFAALLLEHFQVVPDRQWTGAPSLASDRAP
jgi:hypothetical protein